MSALKTLAYMDVGVTHAERNHKLKRK